MLKDENKRKEYDTTRLVEMRDKKLLVQNDIGEEFSENAYEKDNNGSDDGGEGDDGRGSLSPKKTEILNAMGPLVKRVLETGDSDAYKELEQLDKNMKMLNKEEKNRKNDHTLPLDHIQKHGSNMREQLKIVCNSEQSPEEVNKAIANLGIRQEIFRRLLDDLELPPSWVYDVPTGPASSTARQQPGNGNSQTRDSPAGPQSSSAQSSDAMDTTHDWKAGETTKGEKILAIRPRTRTGRNTQTFEPVQMYESVDFVIEITGVRNPIQIVGEDRVGAAAVKAYLELPEDQRCNITRVDDQYHQSDRFKFGGIKGVARDPNATGASHPWTVVLIPYQEKDRLVDRVVNRTALRKALSQKVADRLINRFLTEVGEEPDASMEERRTRREERRLLDALSQHQYAQSKQPSQAAQPMMLGDEEYLHHPLQASGFLRGGRDRTPVSRDRPNGPTRYPPPQAARSSVRNAGPTPARTVAPAEPAARTSIVDAAPEARSDAQRPAAAVGNEQFATKQELGAVMAALQQLSLQIDILTRQNAAAARQ